MSGGLSSSKFPETVEMMLGLTVVMYHYVRDADDASPGILGIPGLPVAAFHAQLDALARTYEMVTWADVRAAVLGERELPERACLLTFDDGTSDHYRNVFPALRARGMSGVFFHIARNRAGLQMPHKLHYLLPRMGAAELREAVRGRLNAAERERFDAAEARYRTICKSETDALKTTLQREFETIVDPWLSEWIEAQIGPEVELANKLFLQAEQVREMRAGGMHFGGHSQTHPWFDYIDPARRAREIRASAEWLGGIEHAPYAFAYPYGGLTDDAPPLLRQAGFAAAFTTRSQVEHADPFYIGRLDGEEVNG